MRFLVNHMPKKNEDCPFAEFHITDKRPHEGYYTCKNDNKICNLIPDNPNSVLHYIKCRWLKEIE